MVRSNEEKRRLPVTRIAGLLFLALCLATRSRWEEREPLVAFLCFLAGCLLAAAGSLGRMWCSLYIAGRKSERLVTEGPYSMCRHPLYFCSATGVLGVGLATETFSLTAIALTLFVIVYPGVIRGEEMRLRRMHGEEYDRYAARTPAFFPRPSLLREPETWTAHPRSFRRHLLSALWFLWFLGILEFAEGLREIGVLPALLHLW